MKRMAWVAVALSIIGMGALLLGLQVSKKDTTLEVQQEEEVIKVKHYEHIDNKNFNDSAIERSKIDRLKLYAAMSRKRERDSSEEPPFDPSLLRKGIRNIEKELKEGQLDAEWAREVARKAEEALERAEVKGVSVFEARCSVSLCSVDFTCDSYDAFEDLATTRLEGPWTESEAVGTAAKIEGQIGMKLYFSKPGLALPVDEDLILGPS